VGRRELHRRVGACIGERLGGDRKAVAQRSGARRNSSLCNDVLSQRAAHRGRNRNPAWRDRLDQRVDARRYLVERRQPGHLLRVVFSGHDRL
jgi:hypothetical protein